MPARSRPNKKKPTSKHVTALLDQTLQKAFASVPHGSKNHVYLAALHLFRSYDDVGKENAIKYVSRMLNEGFPVDSKTVRELVTRQITLSQALARSSRIDRA